MPAKHMAYAEVNDKENNYLWDCLLVYWVDVSYAFPGVAIILGWWHVVVLSCFLLLISHSICW